MNRLTLFLETERLRKPFPLTPHPKLIPDFHDSPQTYEHTIEETLSLRLQKQQGRSDKPLI